jgi:prophage antirepressor-like protein
MSDINLALRVPDEINPNSVRIRMLGTDEHPLFRLADVCKVNGITNIGNVAARLDQDEKCDIQTVDVTGRRQPVVYITEPGFYRVVLSFRSPAAKAFQKWVTGEVLPSIRKHGCYPPPTIRPRLTLQPYTLRVMLLPGIRRHLPRGHWCVFSEAADLLIWAEQVFIPAGLEMQAYDLLDGSVGTHWARFREGKNWTGRRVAYIHQFPDRRGAREAWAYPMQELSHFREWLHQTYVPGQFPNYLQRKCGMARLLRAAPTLRRLGLHVPAAILGDN